MYTTGSEDYDELSIDNIREQLWDESKLKFPKKYYNTNSRGKKEGYYLRRFVRNSSIKVTARLEIEKYGTIQNVVGDGNCGTYSTMEGITLVGIECNLDVNIFKEHVYNYILKHKSSISTDVSFTNRRKRIEELRGLTQNSFIETKIMGTM